MKNPLTPAGIEPATFRFVTQYLNHCAAAVPLYNWTILKLGAFSQVYKKVNLSPPPHLLVNTMKVYRGSRGIVPLVSSLGERRSGRSKEKKEKENSLTTAGIQTPPPFSLSIRTPSRYIYCTIPVIFLK